MLIVLLTVHVWSVMSVYKADVQLCVNRPTSRTDHSLHHCGCLSSAADACCCSCLQVRLFGHLLLFNVEGFTFFYSPDFLSRSDKHN